MPAWSTWAGFDFAPPSPWKIRSPGWRFSALRIRCAGRHLAGHLVGRPSAQHRSERRRARERLELEDAPDEAGAVEAAGRRLAERLLRRFGRAAPDIRVADEGDGSASAPAAGRRPAPGATSSSVCERTRSCSQPERSSIRASEYAASARVAGSLRPSSSASSAAGWLKRRPSRRAIVSVPAPALGVEARVAERGGDRAGGVAEAEEADERGVELADRDGAAGHDDGVSVVDGLSRRCRRRRTRASRARHRAPSASAAAAA